MRIKCLKWSLMIGIAMLLGGSGRYGDEDMAAGGPQYCKDPRPQACTFEYVVVCGVTESGDMSEYSNGCVACADERVVYWKLGECKK